MDPTIVSSVFVDDYDPDIVYKGDWIQVEERPTDMGSMVMRAYLMCSKVISLQCRK